MRNLRTSMWRSWLNHLGLVRSHNSRRRQRSHAVPVELMESRTLLTATVAGLTETPPEDTSGSALHPLSDIPVLNSNPDAYAQLYLDFDGNFESMWHGYRNITSPVFSLDTDRTTFSDWELATIDEVWACVAEDFAPFNINVTTVEPSDFADGHALHVVIGGSPYDWYGQSVGGVGTHGGFRNNEENVVFDFSEFMLPGRNLAEGMADTISHEAGHAFGLEHQGQFDAQGNLINCYRPGDADSGPIMGSTERSERSVWANGPTTSLAATQDEMAVLAGPQNGFGYRPDDHGDVAADASELSRTGNQWQGQGIISTMSDHDVFRFDTVGGQAVFSIASSSLGANLLATAELRSIHGELIATETGSSNGPASLEADLPAGEYLVIVSSNGEYGSVGQYTINGSVTAGAASLPQGPNNLQATSDYGYRHDLAWNAMTDAAGYRVYRRADAGSPEVLIETLPAGTTSATIVVPQTPLSTLDDRWFADYRIEAFNSQGNATSNWQRVQHEFSVPFNTANLQVRALSDSSVELTWQADVRAQVQRLVVMQYVEANTFFYERFQWMPAGQASITLDHLIPGCFRRDSGRLRLGRCRLYDARRRCADDSRSTDRHCTIRDISRVELVGF
jgi:hypothetical protein